MDARSSSAEPWSPPAGKRHKSSSGWYRHQPNQHSSSNLRHSMSPSGSRDASPMYESAPEDGGDVTMPANIPLPRGSMSPAKERSASPSPYPEGAGEFGQNFGETEPTVAPPQNPSNCTISHTPVISYGLNASLTDVKSFDSLCERRYNNGPNPLTLRSRGCV